MAGRGVRLFCFARTFPRAERLTTTMRVGPPMQVVHRRTVWSIVDDDVPDHELSKQMEEIDDIRVEMTMKNALSMYYRKGADVSEIYSQPRVAQAAAEYDKEGIKLQPGWSLDLTRADASMAKAWVSSRPQVQSRVIKLVRDMRALLPIGSPPCTAFFSLQHLSKAKRPRHREGLARRREEPFKLLHAPLRDPDQERQVLRARAPTRCGVVDGGVPFANSCNGRSRDSIGRHVRVRHASRHWVCTGASSQADQEHEQLTGSTLR